MQSTAVPWRAAIRWQPTTAIWVVVLLGVGFALLRAFGVLGPKSLQPLLPLGFVLMMILPWLLLSRAGRQQIGIVRAGSLWNYAGAALSGSLIGMNLVDSKRQLSDHHSAQGMLGIGSREPLTRAPQFRLQNDVHAARVKCERSSRSRRRSSGCHRRASG